MNRRLFIKSALAAFAGVCVAAQVEDFAPLVVPSETATLTVVPIPCDGYWDAKLREDIITECIRISRYHSRLYGLLNNKPS